ncbi:MAG: outer membrane protein assembly factor BamA [Deltaproteobacteria bacterium]|nr:outer membrane protein assembly factor BamA [Deltaproteobacteria bacterium]
MAPILMSVCAHSSLAQNPSKGVEKIVSRIDIQGDLTIERGMIVSGLATRVGDPLQMETVTQDIKNIFSLGYFQNVVAEVEELGSGKVVLVFSLEEKPHIAWIEVKDNTRISKEKLSELVTLRIGGIYNRDEVETSLENIRTWYRKEGFLKTTISADTKEVSATGLGVVFQITESPKIYLSDIRITGTHVYTPVEVRRLMESAEVDCFNWANNSGKVDEMMINQDLQAIAAEYLGHGYIKVFIDKPRMTLFNNPEFTKVKVVLDIREGDQYFTGEVDIQGDILGDKDELLEQIPLKTGDVFNPFLQNQGMYRLKNLYGEQGYAFASVVPQMRVDEEKKIVHLNYQISKGEKAYIGRIEIKGNKETRDYVVRREFTIHEQELYNGAKLQDSINSLQSLGYFKPSFHVEKEPTDVNNEMNIGAYIEEAQTGSLQAQIGYSDQSRLSTSIGVSKGNLFGRGQTIRLKADVSERGVRRSVTADFIEPHLFETDWSSDTSASHYAIEDFTEINRGLYYENRGSQGFGYKFFRNWTLGFTYSGVNRDFSNPSTPSVFLRSVTTGLSRDTVNHPSFPSDGSNTGISVTQTGGGVLEGTHEYRTFRFNWRNFTSLTDSGSVILMAKFGLSLLENQGEKRIPLEERFRIGGITSLRGYDYAEIGGPYGTLYRKLNRGLAPTFSDTRTANLTTAEIAELEGGGIMQRTFTMEMLFPLAGQSIRGVLFYDAGQVNAEPRQYELLHEKQPAFLDMFQSYGGGVRMITPMGVLRFEYGIKIKPLPGDSPGKFDFNISTLF